MNDDTLPPSPARSALMARIRGKNTNPELLVRRLIHALGYGYRIHRADLPGTPDIAFIGRRKAIFVHGCFWHRHEGCSKASMPKTREAYWSKKFSTNLERDSRKLKELARMGWKVLVVWECETKNKELLVDTLKEFLKR